MTPHLARWMENVVTHPPVKPLLTFSNIKKQPERLGRQPLTLPLKIEEAHLVVSHYVRETVRSPMPNTHKPVHIGDASRLSVTGSGLRPETRKGQNQKRLTGGCAHCVITTTSCKCDRSFGRQGQAALRSPKGEPDPQNARPKEGATKIFWCCLLVFKD